MKTKTKKKPKAETLKDFDKRCGRVLKVLAEENLGGYIFMTTREHYRCSFTPPFDEKQWLLFISGITDDDKCSKKAIQKKKNKHVKD